LLDYEINASVEDCLFE